LPGVDMLVKFGYCIICDNGPDKRNRQWVEDLMKMKKAPTTMLRECTNCVTVTPNKNLLYIEVEVTKLGL